MIAVAVQLAALALAAAFAFLAPDAKSARSRALVATIIAVVAAIAEHMVGDHADSSIGLVSCLIGAVAIAMTPATLARASTFGRIALLIAAARLFASSHQPWLLAGCWTASAALAWWELREQLQVRCARVFLFYQFPSVVLFASGIGLLTQGSRSSAALLIALATLIREALMPLHGWFPKFVRRAPMGVVVAFVGPQLGIYAHLALFPQGDPGLTGAMAVVGATTAVLAAALGLVQNDAKRALAFLIMSQTGLVTFGLESHSSVAHQGALLSWQVLALATTGLALLLEALRARGSNLSLVRPSGHFDSTPRLAASFLILGFASVGLPLTLGFVAEELLVQGSVDEFPALALALVVATALNGMSVMRSFFALFTGARHSAGFPDLNRRELLATSALLGLLLVGGVAPHSFIGGSRSPDPAGEPATVPPPAPATGGER